MREKTPCKSFSKRPSRSFDEEANDPNLQVDKAVSQSSAGNENKHLGTHLDKEDTDEEDNDGYDTGVEATFF